jgi:hypothetical protein
VSALCLQSGWPPDEHLLVDPSVISIIIGSTIGATQATDGDPSGGLRQMESTFEYVVFLVTCCGDDRYAGARLEAEVFQKFWHLKQVL